MTVTIYHNPRCSKSRQTLALIQAKQKPVHIIEYLQSDLSRDEIKRLVQLLGSDIRSIIRQTENDFKTLNLDDQSLPEETLIQAIIDNPKLLQRPIVINNNRAVIGRPPENVLEIL